MKKVKISLEFAQEIGIIEKPNNANGDRRYREDVQRIRKKYKVDHLDAVEFPEEDVQNAMDVHYKKRFEKFDNAKKQLIKSIKNEIFPLIDWFIEKPYRLYCFLFIYFVLFFIALKLTR